MSGRKWRKTNLSFLKSRARNTLCISRLFYSIPSLLYILTEKIQEFNKLAVKRGGQEFTDGNIFIIERLVRDNQYSTTATDMLWQMLQWPPGEAIR